MLNRRMKKTTIRTRFTTKSTPFTTWKTQRETMRPMTSVLSIHSKFVIANYCRSSRRSNRSSATTTIIINHLAKQLQEEREARKMLEEELESIKQLSQ